MKFSRRMVMSPGSLPSHPILSDSMKRSPTPARTSPETNRIFPNGAMQPSIPYFFPNTVLSRSVTLAAGSVRIFFSSAATIRKRPSRALFVT